LGEVREFLTTRRAKVTPEQAGLPRYGGRRRVSGLRRDEVAQLAGISIEYYTRLERGNIRGVSDEVLDGIARALHLDEVERAHLLDLVRMANASPTARYQPARQRVRPSVQRLLDSMTNTAAFVRNGRLDILAANPLVGALSMRSQGFRGPWAAHDVDYSRSGLQPFPHPVAGDLDLDYDALEIPADPGQTIITYSAEPGSTARDALDILASWAATHHQ